MGKVLNIAIGIVLLAVLAGGGLLAWSYLKPQPDFVGSKLEADLKEWQSYVNDKPDDPLGRANLGAVYVELGDFDRAVNELKLALDLNPGGYTYMFKLAEAYRKADDTEAAIDMFKQALERYPEQEKYLPAYQIAEIYLERGDLAAAKDYAQQALNADLLIWNSHYLMGQILEREGDKAGAKASYEYAANFNPGDKELQEAIKRVSS